MFIGHYSAGLPCKTHRAGNFASRLVCRLPDHRLVLGLWNYRYPARLLELALLWISVWELA
jgi:hypothetical protein